MPNSKISALTSATTPLAGTEVLPVVQSSITKQVSVANLTAGRSIAVNDVVASGELVSTTNNARISLYRSAGTNYFDWASGQTLAFGTETSQGGAGRVNKVNFTDAGNIEIANGNLVPSTAAKGINFTANTPAAGMTSQLLNWYEAGTWTPSVGGTATYTRQQGYYTRIGRQVTIQCDLIINAIGTGSTTIVTGAPFTSLSNVLFSGAVSYWATLNGSYTFVTPMMLNNSIQFNTTAAASSDITDTSAIFKSGARVVFTLAYII